MSGSGPPWSPGPAQGYQPGPGYHGGPQPYGPGPYGGPGVPYPTPAWPGPPVKVAKPRTIKTLITLGIVFGVLAAMLGATGIVASFIMADDGQDFDGGVLTADLTAGTTYQIDEQLPSGARYMGECQATGPSGAVWDLDEHLEDYGYGGTYTPYTFTTDTSGQYVFRCAHHPGTAGASFSLVRESRPTDWLVFGLPLALLVFGPASLATLIPGLVQRSKAKRFRAMTAMPGWGDSGRPPGPPGLPA